MEDQTYRISGFVIHQTAGQGVAGLRVEAWDKDLIFDDLVGSVVTDAQGKFRIEFNQSYFNELFLDRRPDLFFKVFRGDHLIKSTEGSVLWNLDIGDTAITIEVDVPAGEVSGDARRIVRGRVLASDLTRRRMPLSAPTRKICDARNC